MSLLGRAGRRWLLAHRVLTLLCILGIALGVAVVLAIELAIQSSRRAFSLSADTVTGQATHHIVGGPLGVPDVEYARLRAELGYRNLAPLIESSVTMVLPGPESFTLLGIDIHAEQGFRSFTGVRPEVDIARFLCEPGAVLLAARAQARLGLKINDRLTLRAGARRVEAVLVGSFVPGDPATAAAAEGFLVADMATAQELLGMEGRLTRIEAKFARDDEGRAAAAALAALLSPGLRLLPAAESGRRLSGLLTAFEQNLSFLSLLSLVVGAFLIHQTITFSVVRRRDLFGRLRSLGVTRREVLLDVLAEASALGVIGAAVGVGLGVLLAQGLTSSVAATINDLYFRLSVTELLVPLQSVAKAVGVGLLTVWVGAAIPAWEAARVDVRMATRASAVEERTRSNLRARLLLGVGAASVGALALGWPTATLWPCYLALFGIITAAGVLAPCLTQLIAEAVRPLLGRTLGAPGRLAAAGVVSGLSRTGLAVGALAMAIAMSLGVALMIQSFRGAVVSWLDQTLSGDLYISPASTATRLSAIDRLEPKLLAAFTALPEVSSVTLNRTVTLELESGPSLVVALELGADDPARFDLVEGEEATAVRALRAGTGVLVSEPWAFRTGQGEGDFVRATTAQGTAKFRIVGVFRDYTSDQGYVAMPLSLYRAHFLDDGVTACALFLRPTAPVLGVRASVLSMVLAHGQDLIVNTRAGVSEVSLQVFDRTFRITEILRLLAALVAFAGIVSALSALEIERARERALLRAFGLSRPGLWTLVMSQSALLGVTAALLALPLGVAFAAILTGPINRRSFGWSLSLDLKAWPLLEAGALAVLAAVAAGLWPAARMARVQPGLHLRGE